MSLTSGSRMNQDQVLRAIKETAGKVQEEITKVFDRSKSSGWPRGKGRARIDGNEHL